MRRSTASALLLLMLAGLLAAAAVATVTTPTPACCRAAGPHHCSAAVPDGDQFQGQSCPYRKPLVFSASAAPPRASVAIAPADPHLFLHEFHPELFVSQDEQPHPGRAPPLASH